MHLKDIRRYILRFKEGSIPSIAGEFNILKKIESKEEKGFNFVNEIDYDGKKINVVEYVELVKGKKKEELIERTFVFITDIEISRNNKERLKRRKKLPLKIEGQGS